MNQTKKKCSLCEKTIAINHRFIQCNTCSRNVHIKCNNTDIKSYQEIKAGLIPAICSSCQNDISDTHQPQSDSMPFSSISDTSFRTIIHDYTTLEDSKNFKKITCSLCNKTIAKNHRRISCDECYTSVHIKCNLTDVTTYNKTIKNNVSLKCITCDPTQIIIKPKCCMCNKKIAENHKKLECNTCKNFLHIKCNKTDTKSYEKMIKDNGAPKVDHCCNCLADNIPFQNLSEIEFTAISKGIDTEADILNNTFITSTNLKSFFEEINKSNPFDDDVQAFNVDDPENDAVLINCKYYDLSDFSFQKDKNKFSLFHTNIASLEKHKEELETTLNMLNYKFDIIALTETKIIKNCKPKFNINLEGYKTYFMPTEADKGGTLIYISETIKSKRRLDLEALLYKSEKLESTFIEIINPNHKNMLIGCIYRHPSMDLAEFNSDFLKPFLHKFEKEKKRKYILGEFNVDLLKVDNNENSASYFDTLTSHLFIPHIIHPTRITSTTKTIIDNIFSNATNYQEGISGNLTTRLSDHLAQFLIIPDECNHRSTNKPHYIYDFKNFKSEDFLNELKGITIPDFKSNKFKDPNHAYAILQAKIQPVVNKHLKKRKMTQKEIKNDYKPWISENTIKLIRKRDKIHKHYIKKKMKITNPTEESNKELNDTYTKYKKIRNQITTITRNEKKEYYQTFFTENSDNLRKTWRGVKSIINLKNKEPSPTTLFINNEMETDPLKVANEFNTYISTVATQIQEGINTRGKDFKDYLPPKSENNFFIKLSTKNEVIEIINNHLINNKSTGPNSIPAVILQILTPIFAEHLSDIINLSFCTGIYIDKLKISRIVPIYKEKGDKLATKNYRPISLLPNINKIFEKMMHTRLYDFLEDKNIIFESQFGFRKKHSTTHALVDLTEAIRTAIDDKKFACGIFIDLQKAFDTVDHKILLAKLEHYGVRGVANDWFRSYLKNRKHYVSISETDSETATVNIGVPQGSVLGPLLFLLYINDLNLSIMYSKTRHFADDTCLLYTNISLKQLKKHMNKDLHNLYNWLIANKISLNKDKTEVLLFRHPNKTINYNLKLKLNGKILKFSNSVKYLGVHLDPFLNWSYHVDSLAPKLTRASGMLAKVRHYVSGSTLRNIYFGIFHSLLTYGAQVWGQTQNKHINRITKIQNKALRVINFAEYNSPTTNLYHKSEIFKFADHIKTQNFLFAHDFINHNLPMPLMNLMQLFTDLHHINTRASENLKFSLPKAKSVTGLNSISYKSSAGWNTFVSTIFSDETKSPSAISKYSCKAKILKHIFKNYESES